MKKLAFPLAALVAIFSVRQASAATFTIANGDVPALKAAIVTANSNGRDDIVNLAVGGTYTLTTADNFDTLVMGTGLPQIAADGGKMLTIHGNGATLRRSGASGTLDFRILYIGSSATVSLVELIVSNGSVSLGGGIFNDHGTLIVENCTFTQNSANVGGAINNEGVFASATLCINNSTFSNNFAYFSGGIHNGGAAGSATLNITNSTFSQNAAEVGGAIINDGRLGRAPLSIINCTFSQNSADAYGGAIFNDGIRLRWQRAAKHHQLHF